MAQAPMQEENAVGNGLILDAMSQALLDVSGVKQQASNGTIQQGVGYITRNEVNDEASNLNNAYREIASPDEKVFAVLPKGSVPIATWGGGKVKQLKGTGEMAYVLPKEEYTKAITSAAPMNHNAVQNRSYQQAGAPIRSFDIAAEMKALQDKRGEDLMNSINILQANLDQELARERATIRTQAMMESGAAEAQASLTANIALDREKGFAQQGVTTQQTFNAQQALSNATVIATRLEASMVETSSKVREIMSAKEALKNTFQWKAQKDYQDTIRDQNREDMARAQGEASYEKFLREKTWQGMQSIEKREHELDRLIAKGGPADRLASLQAERENVRIQKSAALRATVTDQQLANYQYVYGTSGDDNQDRMLIVSRRDKAGEKDMLKILNADTTTMYSMLADPDPATREKAYRLINGQDKVLNDPKTAGMDSKTLVGYINSQPGSELVDKLKRIYSDTDTDKGLLRALQQAGVPEEKLKEYRNQFQLGSDKKDNTLKANLTMNLIASVVNSHMESQVRNNVLAWKATELTEGQPLEKVLFRIPPKNGKVSLEDFVARVLIEDIEDPANPVAKLNNKQKFAMIESTIKAATANSQRSMLFPASNVLAAKLVAEANNQATWATVRKALMIDPKSSAAGNMYGVDPATWLRMGQ